MPKNSQNHSSTPDEGVHIENSKKLFEFLEQLAQLNLKVRKEITALKPDEKIFDIDNKAKFPEHKNIYIKRDSEDRDIDANILLSVRRCAIVPSPKLPDDLQRWIPDFDQTSSVLPVAQERILDTEYFEDDNERIDAFELLQSKGTKSDLLKNWIEKDEDDEYTKKESIEVPIYFKDFPEHEELMSVWLETKWLPWKEKSKDDFAVNRIYQELYALRSFLKTEGDSFDLQWSHDLFVWKDKVVNHPTLFTPVELELDSDKSEIRIEIKNSEPSFFDVGFVRETTEQNIADIDDKAKLINGLLKNHELDLWDINLLNQHFNHLAQYVSADGTAFFNKENLEEAKGTKPYVLNKPHLLLLKKTGKSWAEYAKKIKEDIEENRKLTPFLKDLVASEYVTEDESSKSSSDDDIIQDSELYFPLPYNDEQKRIAMRLERQYGAVVQGPPGTGKTHTIANIVSRLLAQGKTVLVTSQTGQALSVLKQKLPKEIRSLAVSQVESGRNSDLQSSVAEINENISRTQTEYDKKIDQIRKDLTVIREDIAKDQKEFRRKSLTDSQEEIILETASYGPISAAKKITELHSKLSFVFEDPIKDDLEVTIRQSDIDQYISNLTALDKDHWTDSKYEMLPDSEDLPGIEKLERLFVLRRDISKEELKLKDVSLRSEELSNIDRVVEYIKHINEHNNNVDKLKKYIKEKSGITEVEFTALKQKYTSGSSRTLTESIKKLKWELESFDTEYEKNLLQVAKSDSQKRRWQTTLQKIEDLLSEHNKKDGYAIGKNMEVSTEYKEHPDDIVLALEGLLLHAKENGGKAKKGLLLFISSPFAHKLSKAITINGRPFNSADDIESMLAYFQKKQISQEVRQLWSQLNEDVANSPKLIENFYVAEIEDLLIKSRRAINFEEKHAEVIEELKETHLFRDVKSEDLMFISEALYISELIGSIYMARETQTLVDDIKSSFAGNNLHEETKKLIVDIGKRDIKVIEQQAEKIKLLAKRKDLAIELHKLEGEVLGTLKEYSATKKENHPQLNEYLSAVNEGEITGIKTFYNTLPELHARQELSHKIKFADDVFRDVIPKTIQKIRTKILDGESIDIAVDENITLKKLESWLESLHEGDALSDISKRITRSKKKEGTLVGELVAESAWKKLAKRVTKEQKESLSSFALSMKNYGKGMGKYAEKHLRDAEKALQVGKNAVPVWIMPLSAVHRLFPNPKAGMFDVVIFDEASQIDILGLNIAYIGKKILVVGDDEQVSPSSFVNQEQVNDLITRYISHIPNSHQFTATSSLFALAKIKLTDLIGLTEHFRSIKEIIGFSNRLSYSGRLKVLRDQMPKYKLNPVLEGVHVAGGYEETNAQVNKAEAQAIVDRIKVLLKDKPTRETNEDGDIRHVTYGVIALLGKDQSKQITKLIGEQIPHELIEKHEILCGDPYTFQGDERDIILLSMVKSHDLSNPDKAISPYTVNKKENKQRMNVAMSRARNKLIVFHSMMREQLSNPDDLRKMILNWIYDYSEEKAKSGIEWVRSKADSEFEIAIAAHIIDRGYEVVPQFEVAGYKIDLVIQGQNARLAVECDGDQYHNRIDQWDADIERQNILERAGWNFWRVSGSAFYRHQEKALDSLWEKLDEMKIYPDGDPRNNINENIQEASIPKSHKGTDADKQEALFSNTDNRSHEQELDTDDIDIPFIRDDRIDFEKNTPELFLKVRPAAKYDFLHKYLTENGSMLSGKERRIIELRNGFFDGRTYTLEEIGREFGVTRERIRQIEMRVYEKIKNDYTNKKQENISNDIEEVPNINTVEVREEVPNNEVLKTRIDTLDIKARTMRMLEAAGIRTVGGLAKRTDIEMVKLLGGDDSGFEQLNDALLTMGVYLKRES